MNTSFRNSFQVKSQYLQKCCVLPLKFIENPPMSCWPKQSYCKTIREPLKLTDFIVIPSVYTFFKSLTSSLTTLFHLNIAMYLFLQNKTSYILSTFYRTWGGKFPRIMYKPINFSFPFELPNGLRISNPSWNKYSIKRLSFWKKSILS